jgi:hypothetical protein
MPVYTYNQAIKLANVVGTDAGNQSMKDGGREEWNDDDCGAALIARNQTMFDKWASIGGGFSNKGAPIWK